jgi:hypothetical protein
LRGPAKGLPVALEGKCHVDLVGWIAPQHLVLRDQARCAFGEENLVAKLDRRAHLAALDQVGMRLEDGIDLLVGSELLTKSTRLPESDIAARKSVRQRRKRPKAPLRRSAKCVTVRAGQGQAEPRRTFAECGRRRCQWPRTIRPTFTSG